MSELNIVVAGVALMCFSAAGLVGCLLAVDMWQHKGKHRKGTPRRLP